MFSYMVINLLSSLNIANYRFSHPWNGAAILGRKEGNVLFNGALNTFYLRLYGVGHMVKDHSDSERGNPLPPHGLLFPSKARVLLYALSHRQDSTYHVLCYTSRGALAGMRNSSMGPPWRIDPTTHRTMTERFYHGATSRSCYLRGVNAAPRTLTWQSLDLVLHQIKSHWQRKEGKKSFINDTLNTFYVTVIWRRI